MSTEAFFEAVWAILVECAGARNDNNDRALFVQSMLAPHHMCHEYRFMGSLGFGGKLWRVDRIDGAPVYVTAYPEDIKAHPRMRAIIDVTNARLAALCAEHVPKLQASA